MKSKYILLLLFSFFVAIGITQPPYIYEGGLGNGYQSISYISNIDLLYKGGLDDGYTSSFFMSNISYLFNGGVDNGYASNNFDISNKYIYNGGFDNGYASNNFDVSNKYIYNGGIDNGYTSNDFDVSNKYIYNGGTDDGYAYFIDRYDFIWTGAVNHGWNVPGNWNTNIIPNIKHTTIIPSNVPNFPYLNTGIFAIGDNPNNGVFESGALIIEQNAWVITNPSNDVENYGNIEVVGNMWVKNDQPSALTNFAQGKINVHNGGNLTLSPANPFICGSTISYGGQDYTTALIGNQCWMTENLNIGIQVTPQDTQLNNNIIEKYCYKNDPAKCTVFGGLYRWDEMMKYSTTEGSQGICPTGWHLPTDTELKELETHLGMSVSDADINGGWRGSNEGSKMAGTYGLWSSGALRNDPDFDSSGFVHLPSGLVKENGTYLLKNLSGYIWTSTENNSSEAFYRRIKNSRTDIYRFNQDKSLGYSVRCVMD